MAERVVNITPTASAEGLREDLEREANNRGKPIRSLVGAIYRYAAGNKGKFTGALKSARRKPGKHIGATVTETVGRALDQWAKQEQTSRGMWCCYLLEKALQDKMLDKIFGSGRDE